MFAFERTVEKLPKWDYMGIAVAFASIPLGVFVNGLVSGNSFELVVVSLALGTTILVGGLIADRALKRARLQRALVDTKSAYGAEPIDTN